MINRLLIANRGEIAVRIMKTAQAQGIECFAIYSFADRNAQHVRQADQALALNGASLGESYLNIEQIIALASAHNIDAIHPGYGFLSENDAFAERCAQANIRFVGPPPSAIQAMGSKSKAKQIMEAANVPLLPGYHGDKDDAELLKKAAKQMGFPVLLKASAGGGGKGMRVVDSESQFADGLAAAKREAEHAFGSSHMIIEKFLAHARHIEVQVFCDSHHNGVYLFERDCSIQRRHQKVVEEAPALGVDEALRKAMGEAAVRAAQAIGYVGAGTVEFLLGEDGDFYFMEMNTRLQVEHPVTEAITGEDLVSWQLTVAEDKPLPKLQDELSINGHAIEVRLYAENPQRGFLPSTGRIALLEWPNGVRIDAGVVGGDTITPLYDPMIAKLIVHGSSRDDTIQRIQSALADTHILGIHSNTQLLRQICAHADFVRGGVSTTWLDERLADLLEHTALPLDIKEHAVASILRNISNAKECQSTWHQHDDFRLGNDTRNYHFDVEGTAISLSLASAKTHLSTAPAYQVVRDHDAYWVHGSGLELRITPFHPARAQTAKSSGAISAPMSGSVIEICCQDGDKVKAGDKLISIEAMKMEHALYAPVDGVVVGAGLAVGDSVNDDQLLLTVEELNHA
ncbi:biotin carboxylase N-terminal domain-containing protein [Umboniibacter marinipuniceus]|uniref:Biotin carboxylase n=1 Tax=Umboniibacter marinipuniceus TaxID=569599 RepID=A0A3M0AJT8_9GAMM|nr:biotin carboxylase N-terminal domain-containing protein [Umboniibacter marinipuniceus]RMA79312.1 3-methylcrotonoyl-CoA carboxylase alpha subunit [Umboniibacter marinipuniceus]